MRYLITLFLVAMPLFVALSQQTGDQSFRSFDKTRIVYTDEGAGEPVILLHGFISNGSSWDDTQLKERLLQLGYRVIIPDMRGNGKSDKPQEPEAYANDAEVKDIIALADHLKLNTYNAVGYSRGSIVLAKLLTKEPRILKAVLGGMGLDFTNPDWDRRIMFQKAFSGEEPLNETTKGAVEYARSINADLKVMSLLQEFQPVTSISELKKIDIPVLVIAGNHDTDNGDPNALVKHLSKGRLEIVPGVHNTTFKGEDFAAAIIDFMKKG